MQNILAAKNEAETLRKTFNNINAIDNSYTFIIPIFKNMPKEILAKPNTNKTPIASDTELVKVNVTNSLRIRNEPYGSKTLGYLYSGEIVTRIEKAQEKVNGTYWDKILKSDGTQGYVARCTYDHESVFKQYLLSLNEEENANQNENKPEPNEINENKQETTNPEQNEINENKPEEINLEKNKLDETKQEETKNNENENTAKGDVNQDGIIDSADLLNLKKYLLNKLNLTDEQKKISDLNDDNTIDSADLLNLKKFLLGKIVL